MTDPVLGGKTALVTGGGRGIGRATCLALAKYGARLLVVARSPDEIEAVAQEVRNLGGEAHPMRADVSSLEDVRRLFETAGLVDILINNAGVIKPVERVANVDPGDWLENININLAGVFLMCRHALPGMLQQRWGRVINVSSGAARGTITGWSAYSAAKAGVEAFSNVVAREVGEFGIRVNVVRPGIVDTQMQIEVRSSVEEQFGRENLVRFQRYKEQGMLRRPEDPALLISWLLSPEAEDINGEVLAIDDPDVARKVGLTPMSR